MAKTQSTERAHLARPLNVMLVGCHLEGSRLGQVILVAPLKKVRADGLGAAAFILKSGHLAVIFILCLWQISALLLLHSAAQKRDQRAAVGSQQDLNSLYWR